MKTYEKAPEILSGCNRTVVQSLRAGLGDNRVREPVCVTYTPGCVREARRKAAETCERHGARPLNCSPVHAKTGQCQPLRSQPQRDLGAEGVISRASHCGTVSGT